LHRILIAGLGNPGQKYKNTRHNAGFMVLDTLALELRTSFREEKKGPKLAYAESDLHGARLTLVKPLEYMNRSGMAVAQVSSFYKIRPENILVVHDDMDIELGRIKFVRSGGPGGHKGVHSIIEALGTRAFPRLKIGIDRPPPEIPADKYVLGRFSPDQMILMEKVAETASHAILVFVEKGIDEAMNRFNGTIIG